MNRKTTMLPALALVLATVAMHDLASAAVDRLGRLEFRAHSDSPEALESLNRGMLLLHLFEFPDARERFRAARGHDPELFWAWWGEAMTHNAPLWNRVDREAAQEVLRGWGETRQRRRERIDATAASTQAAARQRAWLAALEILFSEAPKPVRDRRYAAAMADIAARWPEDDEAALFHALALLGRNGGVRDHVDYMRAAAIATGVWYRRPDHPGAAHYLIHGVDDAVHAPLGLPAARKLAEIAPDAPHAQHMASHVFLAMGMWPETERANRRAVRVAERRRGAALACGHYPTWLHYALVQQGRKRQAHGLLEACRAHADRPGARFPDRFEMDPDLSPFGALVQLWARQLIDTRDWQQPAADWRLDPKRALLPAMTISLVRGLQAFDDGAAETLAGLVGQQRERTALLAAEIDARGGHNRMDAQYLLRARVVTAMLEAMAAAASEDPVAGLAAAGRAAAMEASMPPAFGPPFIDYPAHELLGELQLAAGKPDAALASFTTAVRLAPGRSAALGGQLRAARASGESALAERAKLRLCRDYAPDAARFSGFCRADDDAAAR